MLSKPESLAKSLITLFIETVAMIIHCFEAVQQEMWRKYNTTVDPQLLFH